MRKSIQFIIGLLVIFAGVTSANGNCNNCDYGCDCEGELIRFENMNCGELITTQFSDQGATFESAVYAGRDEQGSGVARSSQDVTIRFSPEVYCVSLKVNSIYGALVTAYDKDGNVLDTAQGGEFFIPDIVEVSIEGNQCISYITVSALTISERFSSWQGFLFTSCCAEEWLCIDNLKFCKCQDNEIPEFPTIALPVLAIIGLALFIQRRK